MQPRRVRRVALIGACFLGLAACGSHVDEGRLARAARGPEPSADAVAARSPGAAADDAPRDTSVAGGPSAGAAPLVTSSPGATAGAAPATAPVRVPAGRSAGAAARVSEGPAGRAETAGGTAPPKDTARPAHVPSTSPPIGTGSKILIGSFGTSSGPIGAVFASVPVATRAWVADVNARGGLAGHPVQVLYADDGGDGGRALSIIRRMVEQDHVLFFLNLYQVTTADAVIPYLEQKQVPVVMSGGALPDEDHSEMIFNPMVGGDLGWVSVMIESLKAQSDQRRIGVLYCRETKACPNGLRRLKENQAKLGIEIVYEAEVSIAQPDYTAEVLQARNAGAEVLASVADAASVVRIVRSALRQNWRPVFLATAAANDDVTVRAADLEGLITVTTGTAPYMNGPWLSDYRDAVAKYVPGGPKGGVGAAGWLAAKLIERLAPSWGLEPTTRAVIDSLYAIDGETLDRRIPPLRFPRGSDRTRVSLCAVPLRFDGETMRAPLGNTFRCAAV